MLPHCLAEKREAENLAGGAPAGRCRAQRANARPKNVRRTFLLSRFFAKEKSEPSDFSFDQNYDNRLEIGRNPCFEVSELSRDAVPAE